MGKFSGKRENAVLALLAALVAMSGISGFAFAEPSDCSGMRHDPASAPNIADKDYDIIGSRLDVSSKSLREGLLVFRTKGFGDAKCKLRFGNGAGSHAQTVEGDKEYVVPLCYGDGEYLVEVFENVAGDSYRKVDSVECACSNSDDAFMYANSVLDFDRTDLTEDMESAINAPGDISEAACRYVDDVFSYDERKAGALAGEPFERADVKGSRLSGKGVCLDYCSVACMMIRMSGIPCKVSVGTCAETGDAPHCWLEVKEDGEWRTIDPTFRDIDPFFSEDGTCYRASYSF